MKVHKVDMDHVRQEAERVKKEQESRGEFTKLDWYKWKVGDNVIRLLPPYNASGKIFRRTGDHYQMPPKNEIHRCMTETWPDQTDVCYFCDTLDRLLHEFPELKLGRQSTTTKYLANVIVRGEEESKGPQVVRFTESMYNWIMLQMSDSQIGDVTDYEQGIDIKVTRKVIKRKDGNDRTEYVLNTMPRPRPLSDDDDIIAKWLDTLPDLDKVLKYPSDDKLSEMRGYASKMESHYVRKYRQDTESSLENPVKSRKPVPAKETSTRSSSKPSESKRAEYLNPKDVPECFAGLDEPKSHDGDDIPEHLKGTFGFQDELDKCMECEHELTCLDRKLDKGI